MNYLALLTVLIVKLQFINSKHTDVVLLGSTGDLAQKYLWQGFFNLFKKYSAEEHTFTFYGCGRSPKHSANEKLNKILENIICEEKDCAELQEKFASFVSYIQLASEKDFKNLGQLLKNSKTSEPRTVIFYLSIPPESYTSTAEKIHQYCHPDDQNVSFRIVFEKPFGYDTNSAIQLQENLEKYFKEEEIYRIDHYLGKSVVREILPFRKLNPEIEKLLNYKHVDRIEVVLKETVDCKGRFNYYNNNGVIRDVLQNHLMEVLLLVTMELEKDVARIPQQKQKLLEKIKTVTPSSVLIGQYDDYLDQSNDEAPDAAEFVPTFAAASLTIDAPKWRGVPVILVSGKSLNERSSYARVIFKNNIFCVSECRNMDQNPQMIFHIGHGGLPSAMILVSKYFHDVKFPPNFNNTEHNLEIKKQIYGKDFSEFFSAVPINETDAYSSLIEDVFNRKKESFIDGTHIVKSWRIWEEVLKYSAYTKPRIYESGDKQNVLDFKIVGSSLEYVKDIEQEYASFSDENSFSPNSFLGRKLVTAKSESLYQSLAKDIASKISQQNTEGFHIAFSGGKSPIRLFQILAELLSDISLNHVHIWQVDERCVPHNSKDSNFRYLWENFLSNIRINIPYDNIHPMPASLVNKRNILDYDLETINRSIVHYIPDLQFDYIVLGVGADGHTASLFPDDEALSSELLVDFTWKYGHRITLTFEMINGAKQISVLVTGKEKREILKQLEESDSSSGLPILKVKPEHGELTWYIDSDDLPSN